jgi:hypothetical protein
MKQGDGSLSNQDDDMSQWKLVYRFFMVDVMAGTTD